MSFHLYNTNYLTKGINGIGPYATQDQQNTSLCQAFRNIVNTPFVENFVYHRLKDHPDETRAGLGLGLVDTNNQYKKGISLNHITTRLHG